MYKRQELNQAIRGLLVKLNERPFQGLDHSRKDLFIALDQPALKTLPQSRYEYAQWRYVKPGIDYHVQIEKRYYSVPNQLVGIRLDARFTDTSVENIPQRSPCRRPRTLHRWVVSTLAEHMLEAHREHYNWSPQRFINWAKNGYCLIDYPMCNGLAVRRELYVRICGGLSGVRFSFRDAFNRRLAQEFLVVGLRMSSPIRESPRLCRGGTQSLTYTGVHQETITCEPPSNTSKEKLDGRTKNVKSLEVGVQIPRSIYTEVQKKMTLR